MTAIIVLLSLFGLLLGAVPAMLVIAVITSANEDLSPLDKSTGGEVPTSEKKFWAYGHFACSCPDCQAAYVQDCADADARVASWQEEEDYCNANGDTIGAAIANEHKRDTSLTLNDMTPDYEFLLEWERAGCGKLTYDQCGMDENEFDDMIRDMELAEEHELASNFATECSTGQYTVECDECGSSLQSNVCQNEFALCNKCMGGEVDGALIAKIAGERQPDEHPTRATSDVGDVLMFCEACGADVYVTQAKHELWQEGGLRIACKEYD